MDVLFQIRSIDSKIPHLNATSGYACWRSKPDSTTRLKSTDFVKFISAVQCYIIQTLADMSQTRTIPTERNRISNMHWVSTSLVILIGHLKAIFLKYSIVSHDCWSLSDL